MYGDDLPESMDWIFEPGTGEAMFRFLEKEQQQRDEVIAADYRAACEHMDPEQLTEGQKFAIAYLSGVPVSYDYQEGGKVIMTTEKPCGIITMGGKWQVVMGVNEELINGR